VGCKCPIAPPGYVPQKYNTLCNKKIGDSGTKKPMRRAAAGKIGE